MFCPNIDKNERKRKGKTWKCLQIQYLYKSKGDRSELVWGRTTPLKII